MLSGEGQNGKGTFSLRFLTALLVNRTARPDYSAKLAPEVVCFATARRARLAQPIYSANSWSQTCRNRSSMRLDEASCKTVTGDDTMTGEDKYERLSSSPRVPADLSLQQTIRREVHGTDHSSGDG